MVVSDINETNDILLHSKGVQFFFRKSVYVRFRDLIAREEKKKTRTAYTFKINYTNQFIESPRNMRIFDSHSYLNASNAIFSQKKKIANII